MKKYEIALVLHPDLEIDLEAPLARTDKALADSGAKIRKRDEWGKRKLAYPIENQSFGIYIFYAIELEPDKLTKLEQQLRLNEEILRHLVVAQTAETPSEAVNEPETARKAVPKPAAGIKSRTKKEKDK